MRTPEYRAATRRLAAMLNTDGDWPVEAFETLTGQADKDMRRLAEEVCLQEAEAGDREILLETVEQLGATVREFGAENEKLRNFLGYVLLEVGVILACQPWRFIRIRLMLVQLKKIIRGRLSADEEWAGIKRVYDGIFERNDEPRAS